MKMPRFEVIRSSLKFTVTEVFQSLHYIPSVKGFKHNFTQQIVFDSMSYKIALKIHCCPTRSKNVRGRDMINVNGRLLEETTVELFEFKSLKGPLTFIRNKRN